MCLEIGTTVTDFHETENAQIVKVLLGRTVQTFKEQFDCCLRRIETRSFRPIVEASLKNRRNMKISCEEKRSISGETCIVRQMVVYERIRHPQFWHLHCELASKRVLRPHRRLSSHEKSFTASRDRKLNDEEQIQCLYLLFEQD